MSASDFQYPLVDIKQLMRGYELAPKFNDLFVKATGLNAWDVDLPAAYRAQVLPFVAPKDQYGIGSCTGFSTSFTADVHYMQMTGDVPSQEEMGKATHPGSTLSDTDKNGNTFVYQDYYPTSFSPFSAWAPVATPCVPNECGGCGASLTDVLDVYKNTGLVRSSTWKSAMDNCQACNSPYPGIDPVNGESYLTQAAGHRISSYSACETLEELKLAIYLHGATTAGIPVYKFPDKNVGIWSCTGNIQNAGHAIALVGWDESGNILNLNSLGPNFTRIGVLTCTPE